MNPIGDRRPRKDDGADDRQRQKPVAHVLHRCARRPYVINDEKRVGLVIRRIRPQGSGEAHPSSRDADDARPFKPTSKDASEGRKVVVDKRIAIDLPIERAPRMRNKGLIDEEAHPPAPQMSCNAFMKRSSGSGRWPMRSAISVSLRSRKSRAKVAMHWVWFLSHAMRSQ